MTKFYEFHEPGLRPVRVHYSQTLQISRREFGLRVPGALGCGALEMVWVIEEYLHTLPEIDLRIDVVLGKRAPGVISQVNEGTIRLDDDGYPLSIALNIYPADTVPAFHTHWTTIQRESVTRSVVLRPPDVFFDAPGRKRHPISSWDDLGSYVGETVEEWK